MPVATPPADLAAAREQFLELVAPLRPDLHRYAARLVGSAIDGEDVLQDALAKAFYLLSQAAELPALRPWMFRVTHNTAIDFLKRYERRNVVPMPDDDQLSAEDFPRDPEVIRAALGAFTTLPVSQRSAVILKDVLDESLEDIAVHLDTTVSAVKSLLVRGRQALKENAASAEREGRIPASAEHRAVVRKYVSLFNQRDWVGVQSLLLEEVRLDLVSKSQRQGKAVGTYFGRYATESDVRLRLGTCEGREVVAVFRGEATTPASVILLETEGSCVSFIRDFRYVPYLAAEIAFAAEDTPPGPEEAPPAPIHRISGGSSTR